jgi:hypothetical protein
MKERFFYPASILAIILLLVCSGCVAPPSENASTPIDLYNPNQFATPTNNGASGPGFVTEIPLEFTAQTTNPSGYTTFLPTTQIPADITCRIYSLNLTGVNGSAFLFDLKNPPMYISYTVVPKNETVTKVYTENILNKKETKTYIFSDYSPQSWFEITVRNNATNEIILQDGFGELKGYPTYLSRTIKVMKNEDLLVEFRNNNIQSKISIWVKPIGNFDESRFSEFTDCTYWDSTRASLVTQKQTTIPGVIYTWTPENKVVPTNPTTAIKQGTEVPRNISNIAWN